MLKRPLLLALLAAVIVPALLLLSLMSKNLALGVAVMTMLGLSFLIWKYDLADSLFKLIALLLPFSLEVGLWADVKMFVPTEPLIALALLAYFWDLALGRRYTLLQLIRRHWFVLPLISAYLLASITSAMPAVSVKFSAVAITYVVVFLVYLRDRIELGTLRIHTLINLYSWSFAIILLYGLFNYASFGFNPKAIKGVFEPFYTDHTILGAAAALLCAWYFGRAALSKQLKTGIAESGVAAFFAAAVLFSSSRAAMWSLIFVFVLGALLWLRIKPWAYAGLILLGLLSIYVYRFDIADELVHIRQDSGDTQLSVVEQAKSVGNVSTDVSNLERLNRWQAGLRMWRERPALGYGPGTFQFEYIPFQDVRFMNRLSVSDPWHIPENSGGSAHSEYILMLAEAGMLGLLSLLLLWGFILVMGVKLGWGNSVIPLLALSTYIFHAFFNNFLSTDKLAFLFYGMAALLISSSSAKNGTF